MGTREQGGAIAGTISFLMVLVEGVDYRVAGRSVLFTRGWIKTKFREAPKTAYFEFNSLKRRESAPRFSPKASLIHRLSRKLALPVGDVLHC